MEQINKLKAELEQVQKELRELCIKAIKNRFNTTEINKLINKKNKLHIKINQLIQKYWFWES